MIIPKGWKMLRAESILKGGRKETLLFWSVSFCLPSDTFLGSASAGHLWYIALLKLLFRDWIWLYCSNKTAQKLWLTVDIPAPCESSYNENKNDEQEGLTPESSCPYSYFLETILTAANTIFLFILKVHFPLFSPEGKAVKHCPPQSTKAPTPSSL